MFQSIAHAIFTTNGEHSARLKNNNLVGVPNIVSLATSDMDSEWLEPLAPNKFDQIVRSHGKAPGADQRVARSSPLVPIGQSWTT